MSSPHLFGVWFVMLLPPVLNGAVRDITYGRLMSELAAK